MIATHPRLFVALITLLVLLALLCALCWPLPIHAQAPPIVFTALWAGPGQSRISWTQPPSVHLTCLRKEGTGYRVQGTVESQSSDLLPVPYPLSPQTLIRCYSDAPAGLYVVTLGETGPLDGNMRPQEGDVFILEQDGVETRAPLLHALWLPLATRESRPTIERLWVAWVTRG